VYTRCYRQPPDDDDPAYAEEVDIRGVIADQEAMSDLHDGLLGYSDQKQEEIFSDLSWRDAAIRHIAEQLTSRWQKQGVAQDVINRLLRYGY
jgi:hypothetical protein